MDELSELIEVRGDDGKLLFKLSKDGNRAFVKVRDAMYVVDLPATVSTGHSTAQRVRADVPMRLI